ncbi:hypothetical protein Hdeb2414_s0205g00832161 [Helianthus debilis subsp. tardiflorus]
MKSIKPKFNMQSVSPVPFPNKKKNLQLNHPYAPQNPPTHAGQGLSGRRHR